MRGDYPAWVVRDRVPEESGAVFEARNKGKEHIEAANVHFWTY